MSHVVLGRRQFVRGGLAAMAAMGMSPRLARAVAGPAIGALALKEASYYDKRPGKIIQCHLCPLECVLSDGQVCFCRTRVNRDGTLYSMSEANPAVVGVDPIEKGPLFHYLPGTQVFALGTAGCNLRCLYCQNWEQAQKTPLETENISLSAAGAVNEAKASGCRSVMMTYTEPVAFFDYALSVAHAARESGYRVQVCSAAFIQPKPLAQLLAATDACAFALKGFTEQFYRKVCGQSLQPVLESIKQAHRSKVWTEIVTLIVPGYNDDLKQIGAMAHWISSEIGPDTPWHLTRFFPAYRLKDLSPTPLALLEEARATAMAQGLHYVYLGNVGLHPGCHTICPKCKTECITRSGFAVKQNRLVGGACPTCKTKIPGIFS